MSTPAVNATGLFTSGSAQNVVPGTFAASSSDSISTVETTSIFVSTSSQSPSVVQESFGTTPSSTQSDGQSTITLSQSEVVVTVATTQVQASGVSSAGPQTILVTSTESGPRFPAATTSHTSASSASSASKTSSAALATSAANASSNSGLSPGGKIAVAVVVPVVAVALIVLAALFLWRKRKQRKDAEELRRKEVEEYGFNPNHDPTLPAVAGASSNGDEPPEMAQTDGSGYRGWGATSTARKGSTTLSSGNGPVGVARSTSNSDNGRYTNGSPTAGTNKSSDGQSNDPLVGSSSDPRPLTADSETIGALGAVPSNGNRQEIHRGPSNASSAYSGAHRSDTSGEGIIPRSAPGQQYYNDGMYYDEGMPAHGPYGDGSYGGGQPVIRDVPARRNTRIENPSVIPQQGSAGIAQNF